MGHLLGLVALPVVTALKVIVPNDVSGKTELAAVDRTAATPAWPATAAV